MTEERFTSNLHNPIHWWAKGNRGRGRYRHRYRKRFRSEFDTDSASDSDSDELANDTRAETLFDLFLQR